MRGTTHTHILVADVGPAQLREDCCARAHAVCRQRVCLPDHRVQQGGLACACIYEAADTLRRMHNLTIGTQSADVIKTKSYRSLLLVLDMRQDHITGYAAGHVMQHAQAAERFGCNCTCHTTGPRSTAVPVLPTTTTDMPGSLHFFSICLISVTCKQARKAGQTVLGFSRSASDSIRNSSGHTSSCRKNAERRSRTSCGACLQSIACGTAEEVPQPHLPGAHSPLPWTPTHVSPAAVC